MNVQTTIDETVWQPRLDALNEERRALHDASEQFKPEAERKPFKPLTIQEFVRERVSEIEQSIAAQSESDALSKARSSPEFSEIVRAIAKDGTLATELKAAIDKRPPRATAKGS